MIDIRQHKKIMVFCITHKIAVYYLWGDIEDCELLIFDLSEGSTPYYR